MLQGAIASSVAGRTRKPGAVLPVIGTPNQFLRNMQEVVAPAERLQIKPFAGAKAPPAPAGSTYGYQHQRMKELAPRFKEMSRVLGRPLSREEQAQVAQATNRSPMTSATGILTGGNNLITEMARFDTMAFGAPTRGFFNPYSEEGQRDKQLRDEMRDVIQGRLEATGGQPINDNELFALAQILGAKQGKPFDAEGIVRQNIRQGRIDQIGQLQQEIADIGEKQSRAYDLSKLFDFSQGIGISPLHGGLPLPRAYTAGLDASVPRMFEGISKANQLRGLKQEVLRDAPDMTHRGLAESTNIRDFLLNLGQVSPGAHVPGQDSTNLWQSIPANLLAGAIEGVDPLGAIPGAASLVGMGASLPIDIAGQQQQEAIMQGRDAANPQLAQDYDILLGSHMPGTQQATDAVVEAFSGPGGAARLMGGIGGGMALGGFTPRVIASTKLPNTRAFQFLNQPVGRGMQWNPGGTTRGVTPEGVASASTGLSEGIVPHAPNLLRQGGDPAVNMAGVSGGGAGRTVATPSEPLTDSPRQGGDPAVNMAGVGGGGAGRTVATPSELLTNPSRQGGDPATNMAGVGGGGAGRTEATPQPKTSPLEDTNLAGLSANANAVLNRLSNTLADGASSVTQVDDILRVARSLLGRLTRRTPLDPQGNTIERNTYTVAAIDELRSRLTNAIRQGTVRKIEKYGLGGTQAAVERAIFDAIQRRKSDLGGTELTGLNDAIRGYQEAGSRTLGGLVDELGFIATELDKGRITQDEARARANRAGLGAIERFSKLADGLDERVARMRRGQDVAPEAESDQIALDQFVADDVSTMPIVQTVVNSLIEAVGKEMRDTLSADDLKLKQDALRKALETGDTKTILRVVGEWFNLHEDAPYFDAEEFEASKAELGGGIPNQYARTAFSRALGMIQKAARGEAEPDFAVDAEGKPINTAVVDGREVPVADPSAQTLTNMVENLIGTDKQQAYMASRASEQAAGVPRNQSPMFNRLKRNILDALGEDPDLLSKPREALSLVEEDILNGVHFIARLIDEGLTDQVYMKQVGEAEGLNTKSTGMVGEVKPLAPGQETVTQRSRRLSSSSGGRADNPADTMLAVKDAILRLLPSRVAQEVIAAIDNEVGAGRIKGDKGASKGSRSLNRNQKRKMQVDENEWAEVSQNSVRAIIRQAILNSIGDDLPGDARSKKAYASQRAREVVEFADTTRKRGGQSVNPDLVAYANIAADPAVARKIFDLASETGQDPNRLREMIFAIGKLFQHIGGYDESVKRARKSNTFGGDDGYPIEMTKVKNSQGRAVNAVRFSNPRVSSEDVGRIIVILGDATGVDIDPSVAQTAGKSKKVGKNELGSKKSKKRGAADAKTLAVSTAGLVAGIGVLEILKHIANGEAVEMGEDIAEAFIEGISNAIERGAGPLFEAFGDPSIREAASGVIGAAIAVGAGARMKGALGRKLTTPEYKQRLTTVMPRLQNVSRTAQLAVSGINRMEANGHTVAENIAKDLSMGFLDQMATVLKDGRIRVNKGVTAFASDFAGWARKNGMSSDQIDKVFRTPMKVLAEMRAITVEVRGFLGDLNRRYDLADQEIMQTFMEPDLVTQQGTPRIGDAEMRAHFGPRYEQAMKDIADLKAIIDAYNGAGRMISRLTGRTYGELEDYFPRLGISDPYVNSGFDRQISVVEQGGTANPHQKTRTHIDQGVGIREGRSIRSITKSVESYVNGMTEDMARNFGAYMYDQVETHIMPDGAFWETNNAPNNSSNPVIESKDATGKPDPHKQTAVNRGTGKLVRTTIKNHLQESNMLGPDADIQIEFLANKVAQALEIYKRSFEGDSAGTARGLIENQDIPGGVTLENLARGFSSGVFQGVLRTYAAATLSTVGTAMSQILSTQLYASKLNAIGIAKAVAYQLPKSIVEVMTERGARSVNNGALPNQNTRPHHFSEFLTNESINNSRKVKQLIDLVKDYKQVGTSMEFTGKYGNPAGDQTGQVRKDLKKRAGQAVAVGAFDAATLGPLRTFLTNATDAMQHAAFYSLYEKALKEGFSGRDAISEADAGMRDIFMGQAAGNRAPLKNSAGHSLAMMFMGETVFAADKLGLNKLVPQAGMFLDYVDRNFPGHKHEGEITGIRQLKGTERLRRSFTGGGGLKTSVSTAQYAKGMDGLYQAFVILATIHLLNDYFEHTRGYRPLMMDGIQLALSAGQIIGNDQLGPGQKAGRIASRLFMEAYGATPGANATATSLSLVGVGKDIGLGDVPYGTASYEAFQGSAGSFYGEAPVFSQVKRIAQRAGRTGKQAEAEGGDYWGGALRSAGADAVTSFVPGWKQADRTYQGFQFVFRGKAYPYYNTGGDPIHDSINPERDSSAQSLLFGPGATLNTRINDGPAGQRWSRQEDAIIDRFRSTR